MATNHGNDNQMNDLRFFLSSFDEIIDVLPSSKNERFDWYELIHSKEVMEKALKKQSLIQDFKNLDPYGMGLPIFSFVSEEDYDFE
jgi:hypothetical protein